MINPTVAASGIGLVAGTSPLDVEVVVLEADDNPDCIWVGARVVLLPTY